MWGYEHGMDLAFVAEKAHSFDTPSLYQGEAQLPHKSSPIFMQSSKKKPVSVR